MGCRVCRARKVKCDGRPNGCRNCERLQLDCVGDDGSFSSTAKSPVSLRKIRTYRSCTSCRLSKTKCNGDRPKCSRCTSKKLECVYDGGATPRWTKSFANKGAEGEHQGDHSGSGEGGSSPEVDRSDEGVRPPTGSSTLISPTLQAPSQMIDLSASDPFAWLLAPELPPSRHLRRIVDHYFANIHPIRCFAFVHKPSFMRQLDNGFHSDDDSALLHIICAHGAKFHTLSLAQNDVLTNTSLISRAGNQWAQIAEEILLSGFGKISVQRLMTAVLLYDFRFRLGDYGKALMLSGLTVRLAQALKINKEYSSDILCADTSDPASPSVVTRESRRRLMWAVFALDAWTGTGSEQMALLRESDIKIQLPCNERSFGLRIASVTETLGVGHVLQSLPPAVVPKKPAANMGIMAYYVRIVTLRKRVVRYIKHIDRGPPPWQSDSEFAALDADIAFWRRELPDFVSYSPDTIYARLDSNQLGALMLIHCTYHHNYLELYKVSMPELFRLRSSYTTFPAEQTEMLQALQADCYFHARQISKFVTEAAEHGPRLLSDGLLPFFIFDSCRVMLYYVAKLLDPERIDAQEKFGEAISSVEGNIGILKMMMPLYPTAESLCEMIERWLFKVKSGSWIEPTTPRTAESDNGIAVVPRSTAVSSAASTSMTSDFAIAFRRTTQSIPSDRTPLAYSPSSSRRASCAPGNTGSPPAAWDRASAAAQLIGLSQDREGSAPKGHKMICEGLDLDDLQNCLSWDMAGIMDVVGENSSNYEAEDVGMSSWASAV